MNLVNKLKSPFSVLSAALLGSLISATPLLAQNIPLPEHGYGQKESVTDKLSSFPAGHASEIVRISVFQDGVNMGTDNRDVQNTFANNGNRPITLKIGSVNSAGKAIVTDYRLPPNGLADVTGRQGSVFAYSLDGERYFLNDLPKSRGKIIACFPQTMPDGTLLGPVCGYED